jgi:hypothetical protein
VAVTAKHGSLRGTPALAQLVKYAWAHHPGPSAHHTLSLPYLMREDHRLPADSASPAPSDAAAPRTAALPTMAFDDDMYGTEKSFGRGSQASDYYGEASVHRDGIGRRVIESFKRDPNFNMTPKGSLGADGKVFDVETAAQNTANSPLARKLKGRHLQMIAIGGSIGVFWHVSLSVICTKHLRYRSVCRLWPSAGQRWTRCARHLLLHGRSHAVLHCPRSG